MLRFSLKSSSLRFDTIDIIQSDIGRISFRNQSMIKVKSLNLFFNIDINIFDISYTLYIAIYDTYVYLTISLFII